MDRVFEDEQVLVLDKPSGIVVNKSQTAKKNTLQDQIQEYLKVDGDGIGDRQGIVHRLDKDTSGLLIVAKTQKAFTHLQAQFKERKVEKSYTALVAGLLPVKEGTIQAPVSRNPFNRKKFGVFLGGREARTDYRVIKEYHGRYSLLKLQPKTGRTHQIRIHLKHLGFPIITDSLYAGRKNWRSQRQWCSRMFLHADKISFTHPQTGKRLSFSSPLPSDLTRALQSLN